MDGFSIFILFLICVELNIDVKFMLLRYEKIVFYYFIFCMKKLMVYFFFFC